jgi:rubredoxin
MSLTIDVVETDFSSASEYITFIYAGREIMASNLLVLDGNDATLQSCSSFTRLLDAVDVPEDAIETAGSDRFLKIRLETTASVGGNTACSGKTLYAKVYVRFRCQACRQGHYKSASGPEECQACGTASYSDQTGSWKHRVHSMPCPILCASRQLYLLQLHLQCRTRRSAVL